MITYIKFSNFKSFHGDVTIDFAQKVTPDIAGHGVALGGRNVSHVLGFLGANSVGKSNLIEAMSMLRYYLQESFLFDDENPYRTQLTRYYPFLYGSGRNSAGFEVGFYAKDNNFYTYDFEYNESAILQEHLRVKSSNSRKPMLIFSRNGKTVSIKDSRIPNRSSFKDVMNRNSKALILTTLTYFKTNPIVEVANELLNEIYVLMDTNYPHDNGRCLENNRLLNDDFKKFVLKLINVTEPDIVDFKKDELAKLLGEDKIVAVKVFNGIISKLSLNMLPSNVKYILDIAYAVKSALDRGSLLCVDNLGALMHPLLKAYIIGLFLSHETNPNDAQLLFTSSDSSILDNGKLGREELGIIDKNSFGESFTSSLLTMLLSDGKRIRKSVSYERAFLDGKLDSSTRQLLESVVY